MGILRTKLFRDIRQNKGRSFSIVFIIMIASGLYGGLLLTSINALDTFANLEDETHLESVRYSLNDFINVENLTLDSFDGIEYWDTRIASITNLRLEENAKISYTAPIFGVNPDSRPKVNDFVIEDGEYFTGDNQILITTQFFQGNELAMGDEVWIETPAGKEKMTIQAEIVSPEYLYNVNPVSGLPEMSGLAASWLSLDTVQNMFDLDENFVNEVLVRFDQDLNEDKINQLINEIKEEIREIAPNVSYTVVKDEMEQTMKDADVGLLDEFARVFGIIILLIGLFIMYDNISKMIASQRNYIGTMRALGGHKEVVVSHYTWMSLFLALIGVILGVPFGYEVGNEMNIEYSHILGIPTPVNTFHIEPFIESFLITLGLAIAISLISSISAAKIDPREAMASAFVTVVYKSKPILEKITSKIPGLNSPSMTIPLRSLFRSRRKSTLTIFTFSISMILMITSLGFMDSFHYGLNSNYENIQKYDMEMYFYQPILPDEIYNVTDGMDAIAKVEIFSSTVTEVSRNNYNKSVVVEGLIEDSTLRKFDLIEGDDSGMVVGSILANEFNVSIGDDLEFYNRTFEIQGISRELLGAKIFLSLTLLQDLLDHDNNVTSAFVKGIEGSDLTQLKNDLLNSDLPVGIVIVTEEVIDSFNVLIQGLMALIYVMLLIGFGIIALFSFNTIVLDVMSREMEFVNLRTLGAGRWKIFKVVATQGVIISVLGSLLAIPISYYAVVLAMDELVGELMYLPVHINPETYAMGIIAALLASAFGVWAAFKKIMNIDLADAMRVRMAN